MLPNAVIQKFPLLIFAPLLLSACSNAHVTNARLYDFTSGFLIDAQVIGLGNHHGRMTAQLPSGEKLRGEFTLTNEKPSSATVPGLIQLNPEQRGSSLNDGQESGRSVPKGGKSLAQVYGFSGAADARPVATATLVGTRGTVVEVVFYSLDAGDGTGTGIGRDNKGDWYSIRLGI